jgi:hypothetical protein
MVLCVGSALIQACEAAGATIPRCVHLRLYVAQHLDNLNIRQFLLPRPTCNRGQLSVSIDVYPFIKKTELLMVPRMCLVEVERSPKPIASW